MIIKFINLDDVTSFNTKKIKIEEIFGGETVNYDLQINLKDDNGTLITTNVKRKQYTFKDFRSIFLIPEITENKRYFYRQILSVCK